MTAEGELTCDFTDFLSQRLGVSPEETVLLLGAWVREQHRLRRESEGDRRDTPVIGAAPVGDAPSLLRKTG